MGTGCKDQSAGRRYSEGQRVFLLSFSLLVHYQSLPSLDDALPNTGGRAGAAAAAAPDDRGGGGGGGSLPGGGIAGAPTRTGAAAFLLLLLLLLVSSLSLLLPLELPPCSTFRR